MISKIALYLLSKRVGWGNPIIKPFDKWLYKLVK